MPPTARWLALCAVTFGLAAQSAVVDARSSVVESCELGCVLVVPEQIVPAVLDASGRSLGPAVIEAEIRFDLSGSAAGGAELKLRRGQTVYEYTALRSEDVLVEDGQLKLLTLVGIVTWTARGERMSDEFRLTITPHAVNSDCLIWDILGGNVHDAPARIDIEGFGFVSFSDRTSNLS